uniref:Uncharacterized protein LOC104224445 n=1 Tax=Nicotiana sylvestris TaxID=4096 RepID=A0A1U7WJH8_NICSY|nr:PREDICTED: uncharacterized protein LOC104224445 [Nicotiana sylvestris]
MSFPKKWNMKPVAQMPEPILELKQWVESLVSQRPYSKRAWMELSKGQWEARNHGLVKDVTMRLPSGDEEVFPQPSALKQAQEKKRKEAPSCPSLEKKSPAKRSRRSRGCRYYAFELNPPIKG